ncbi:procollagen-lysine,2-oxoglutarate 5-dioxygenase 2-like [Homalodisca vitripennis]|uniref:procollagen-lysine,2-oxoglutarate 5-dioxygenase 2-like n=1 Tax=Homalodisca vitripennis TaxID=197043 RepID=UPI001EEA8CA7|nr:procollagen-lysine,2-oxoglutarate 5-dioxygenase 2-like [Homalodisca vitripennis]
MIKAEDEIKEADARMFAVDYCMTKECDYLLSVDSFAHLDNPNTLKALIKLNRLALSDFNITLIPLPLDVLIIIILLSVKCFSC